MNLSKEQKRLKQNGVRCLRGGTVHLVAGVSLVGMEDYMIAPHAQFPQAEPDAFTIAMEDVYKRQISSWPMFSSQRLIWASTPAPSKALRRTRLSPFYRIPTISMTPNISVLPA